MSHKDEPFDFSHHGDEVVVRTNEDRIHVDWKIQISHDTFRHVKMHFETQTQLERLFHPIAMTLLKDAGRKR